MVTSYHIAAETPSLNTMMRGRACPATGGANLVADIIWDDVEHPERDGMLSIKCAFGGRETYRIGGSRVDVSDTTYLIINQGQRYASEIRPGRGVNSFCIFFRNGFAQEVLHDCITPEDRLLDDPETVPDQSVRFFEKLYRHDAVLSPLLHRVRFRMRDRLFTPIWLDEQFYTLLLAMLDVHRNVRDEITRLPGVKPSTRVETYRRVQHGREYMESYFDRQITLADIAEAACLSPYHFLRLFKSVFGITPGQYLTQRRIDQARRLLVTTDMPVVDICTSVGFISPTTFNLLFRRNVGTTPQRFRRSTSAA